MKIGTGQRNFTSITTIGNRPARSIRPTEVFHSLIGVEKIRAATPVRILLLLAQESRVVFIKNLISGIWIKPYRGHLAWTEEKVRQ
jgi:hypothetical protein